MDETARFSSDQVYPSTRILAIVVVPFLVVAAFILYFFPERSGQLFAWPVKPPINAMLLAAAYSGGIYFFTRAALARRWHTIKAGFLPVTSFAGLLGIATLLHWDKFTHGSPAFFAWAGLYFSTPFLVMGAWLHNQAQDVHDSGADDLLIPPAWRIFFGLLALATLPFALVLFISPGMLIPLWPWTLTPLTARVLAAMFALPAVLSLEITIDSRWSFARILLEAQAISLVLFVIAIFRDQAHIDTANPFYGFFLGMVLAILAVLLVLFVRMRLLEQRAKTMPGSQ